MDREYESKEYRDMKAQKMAILEDVVIKVNLTKDDLQLLSEGKTVGFYNGKVRIVVI